MLFITGMATFPIRNIHINTSTFTPLKNEPVKGAIVFISEYVKQLSQAQEKLLELRNKYFKDLSLTDKLLIKLGLKKDISPSMAILDYIGAEPVKLAEKNTISIESYGYKEQLKIKKLGLTEADALKHVSSVRRNADFNDSELTDLQNIKSVGNNLYLAYSKVKNINNLEYVGRHVYINENLSEKDFANTYVTGCILR